MAIEAGNLIRSKHGCGIYTHHYGNTFTIHPTNELFPNTLCLVVDVVKTPITGTTFFEVLLGGKTYWVIGNASNWNVVGT